MALPSGYTQYEYIESSGTQYIDTGFQPNQDSRVTLKVNILSSSSATCAIFGARNGSSTSGGGSFVLWRISGSFRADYASTSYSFSVPSTGAHEADYNQNTVQIDSYTHAFTARTFQANPNLLLFAVNNNGTPDTRRVHAQLEYAKIYDNGTLIRDYIPCSDPSGEVGLYDQVSGVFYGNAGTGTFGYGPVATPPAPQNLRQTGKTLESISLAWDAVEAADGYKLYRDGALIATQTATSYTDTGLLPSESHSYQVMAYNDQGDGTLSESVSMSTEQAYYVVTPVFTSAVFSQNPTIINTPVLLSVAVEDQMIILQPEVFQSNEIYSGEAS